MGAPRHNSRRATAALLAGLALLTLIPFAQTVRFDFVRWDDGQYVTDNQRVQQGLSWENTAWSFTTGFGGTWQPLVWHSHMLDVELFGLWPGGHHLTNVVIHLANTLLLFALMRRLLPGPPGAVFWEAGFVAAVFAVHPLHVESVAWVSERKDVLSGFFFIAALLAYTGYARRPGALRYAGVTGAFALGLMAKPMVVTLPVVLLLLDSWPLGRLTGPRAAVRLTVEKAPLFLLSLAAAALTLITQAQAETVSGLDRLGVGMRLANAVTGYVRYLGKTLWPVDLAAHYPFPIEPYPAWQVAAAGALLLGITAGALLLARRTPWFAVGWLCYLVTLLPVIGIVQVGSQAIADRYMYLPMLGLLIVAGRAGTALARRGGTQRKAVYGVAALALAALTVLCVFQARLWRDTFTLFRASAERVPESALAHYKTGYAYHLRGDLAQAAYRIRRALELELHKPEVYRQYAQVLMEQGRVTEALAAIAAGLKRFPEDVRLRTRLGMALLKAGRYKEAAVQLEEALALAPDAAAVRDNLAAALLHAGEYAKAEALLREALETEPHDPLLLTNLGVALAEQGSIAEARRRFEQALAADPAYQAAQDALRHYAGPR